MNTDGWLTKAEAAAIAEVDERTIERAARAGHLSFQPRPGHPTLYNPVEVERWAVARRTGVRPVVLAADQTPSSNGHGAIAHQRHESSPREALLVEVLQALREVLAQGPTGATGPTHGPTPTTGPTLWVTVAEASAVSGLSQAYLRRQIEAGTLKAEKDRGWKIRRRDLEAL